MFYRILFLLACACNTAAGSNEAAPLANPLSSHALRSSERHWQTGEVVERLETGPYTYLRLREPDGHAEWFVSLRATTPADTHVRALVIGRAERFHSRRLGREFSPLSFAAVRRAADPASNNPTPEIAP